MILWALLLWTHFIDAHTQVNPTLTEKQRPSSSGTPWTQGTRRAERIQRWSSKDWRETHSFYRVHGNRPVVCQCIHTHVGCVGDGLFVLQGQKGKAGPRGLSGSRGPPVSKRCLSDGCLDRKTIAWYHLHCTILVQWSWCCRPFHEWMKPYSYLLAFKSLKHKIFFLLFLYSPFGLHCMWRAGSKFK